MKLLVSLLFVISLLFGYQKGDEVDQAIIQKLELQQGKIYVIDFFASWCDSCKKEMPLLIDVAEKIDTNSTELIGVDVDEEYQKGQAFQKEMGITFRVVDDRDNTIIKAFDPLGMPSLYVVKDGKILDLLFGAHDGIDQLILDEIKALTP